MVSQKQECAVFLYKIFMQLENTNWAENKTYTRFVMVINSCMSSFQSLGSAPGSPCVTQESESALRELCVRGENLFLASLFAYL